MKDTTILAIDIGGGTQDILLHDPNQPMENAVKLVLPSPTMIAARRIHAVTAEKRPLFLSGRVMGGGAVSRAVRAHLQAGLPVYSLEAPALTLHDNLTKVQSMGVEIVPERPARGEIEVVLGDLDLDGLERALSFFEVSLPPVAALAIQDHGFSPQASNRLTRFAQWQRFMDAGGDIADLLYVEPPAGLSRMAAAAESLPNAFFMDTGAAALRGAMLDETAAAGLAEGLLMVNVGNEHTVAALVRDRRVWGIYEHHTSLLDPSSLADHMNRFASGELTHWEIFDQMGHGVAYQPDYPDVAPFRTVVVTGPQRAMAKGLGHLAAPFGEMMLSGCFGLVEAVREYYLHTGRSIRPS